MKINLEVKLFYLTLFLGNQFETWDLTFSSYYKTNININNKAEKIVRIVFVFINIYYFVNLV